MSSRILSLLPSTTEIVGALGLADRLVGVTHECDVCPDEKGMERLIARGVERVTTAHINPHVMSQHAIDDAVKSSLSAGLSLYQLDEEAVRRSKPTVVLTQALCSVCAPAYDEVRQVCQALGAALADDAGGEPAVLSLEPSDLAAVGETFVTIGAAAGAEERGHALKQEFEGKLRALQAITATLARPKVLLLEWLDPPFSGGHWVPEQIQIAGGEPVTSGVGEKSTQLSWDAIEAADPDVVVVACCGFDLARNLEDTRRLLSQDGSEASRRFRSLRAVEQGRLYALDGNRYFARPAPSLAEGAAILARVIHAENPTVVSRLDELAFLPSEGTAWAHVPPFEANSVKRMPTVSPIENLHEQACAAGQTSYLDPATGYRVFTRLGLERRGTCCGCGCRHCPYGHVNVQDKAARIQQPAFLHRRERRSNEAPRHVLFWSGGKDSLLALRAWLRSRTAGGQDAELALDSLVLLTTFDAITRTVAHQEVPISDVERQARALDLDLVGVPLHAGMEYLERVRSGLERVTAEGERIESLVFGDLHLAHIREWREGALSQFGLRLDYPVWQVEQRDLMEDLVASDVPCVVSACPGDPPESSPVPVHVGSRFDHQLADSARRAGWDAFGENGEFHTLAQVWQVPRHRALGIAERSS